MIELVKGQLAQRLPAKSEALRRARRNIAKGDFGRGAIIMFYIYVFYDKNRKVFYIGYTNDLRRRVNEHNRGKTHTTYRMADKLLVYYEASLSKKDAIYREKQLKTGFGRAYLKRRLKNYLEGV